MNIRRGEVWLVNLDPTVGAEIRKTRPVVVISSDAIGSLPIRLVAPITEWKDHFTGKSWQVKLLPSATNNLAKASAVDALQLRGLDTSRFLHKLGQISKEEMRTVVDAIAIVIDY
jgi:mRNA interferase MazF